VTERQFRWTGRIQRRIREKDVGELVPLTQGPRKMILPELRASAWRPRLTWREKQDLQTVLVLHEGLAQAAWASSSAILIASPPGRDLAGVPQKMVAR
jgi:hypothetical protein